VGGQPFYDRSLELAALEAEWRRGGFSLAIVYGRRRVGKTALLRRFLRGRRGVYYVAAELPAERLHREFAEVAGEELGVYLPGDIVAALERIASMGERVAVVLDEFQYIAEADPGLASRLQRSIDTRLAESRLMLILCGSAVSFFEERLLGGRAPLFGRRTRSLKLRPLKLLDAHGFYQAAEGFREEAAMYAVLGGTPAYALHATGARRLEELLARILEPGHPLLTEPLDLLRQELREPRSYLSLLQAIAEGRTRSGEAAQAAGIDPRSIHHYLAVLEQLDIVEKRRPLGRRKGHQLAIKDPFFAYWLTVTPRVQSLVEAGLRDKAVETAKRLVEERLLGPVLEKILQDHLPELHDAGLIPVTPIEHGPWWARGEEIDIVVRDPGHAAAFIEVKTRATQAEAEHIARRLRAKAAKTGLQEPANHYIVAAAETDTSGPTTTLGENTILLNLSEAWRILVERHRHRWRPH